MIDVGTKTELYKHLRAFAESGKSVIYMSSELEEFIGFATRVLVFRDGGLFDTFDRENVDAKRILEAMFGQTDGAGPDSGERPIPTQAVEADQTPNAPETDGKVIAPSFQDEKEIYPQHMIANIKIIEFDANGQALNREGR